MYNDKNIWGGGGGGERDRGLINFYGEKFAHLNYFAKRNRRKKTGGIVFNG